MKHLFNRSFVTIMAFAVGLSAARGTTINVPEQYTTVQQALNACSPGDEVVVNTMEDQGPICVQTPGIVITGGVYTADYYAGTAVTISAGNVLLRSANISGAAYGIQILDVATTVSVEWCQVGYCQYGLLGYNSKIEVDGCPLWGNLCGIAALYRTSCDVNECSIYGDNSPYAGTSTADANMTMKKSSVVGYYSAYEVEASEGGSAAVSANGNRLLVSKALAVTEFSQGNIDANIANNWHGSNAMPDSDLPIESWLVLRLASPAQAAVGEPINLLADLLGNNIGDEVNPDSLAGIDGFWWGLDNGTFGYYDDLTFTGQAGAEFTPEWSGTANISLALDNETITTQVQVN